MDNQKTSPKDAQATLTQHAMLVVWGLYAQQIGLIDRWLANQLHPGDTVSVTEAIVDPFWGCTGSGFYAATA